MSPDPHGAADVGVPPGPGAGTGPSWAASAASRTAPPIAPTDRAIPEPTSPAVATPSRSAAARPVTPSTKPVRRGRRVKRVIRRVELWSVLKLSIVFYTCMYVVALAALAVLWGFAHSTGLVDNFESFANDVGWENWQFYGEDMFRQVAVIGGVLVLMGTVLTVLAAALVNVISELTGGIRVVVIEEDVVMPDASSPSLAPPPAPAGGGRRGRRA